MNESTFFKSAEGQKTVMGLYDGVLDRWPVPYEGVYVDTRHGRTFVIASGDPAAPALVLLHGANSNAVSWIADVPVYSRHFRVYAIDTPGEPGRSAQVRRPYTGPAYAEWLEEVLDSLGASQTALIGISQGGWNALKFATSHPERVSRLVLLAPGGVVPARLSFILRAIPLSMMGRPGAEAINRIVFGDQPIHPEAVAFMNAIMTHFRPRIDGQPMHTDDELRRLTMPVLLIVGAKDALIPGDKTAARLQPLLPHLEVRVLPDTGHALVNLAPEIVPFLLGTPGRVPAGQQPLAGTGVHA